MATPAGTYTTHTAIGVREDLHDVIFDISPMDTPLMSNISRITVEQPLHEWLTDTLAAASAVNAHIEGDDASAQVAVDAKRFSNRTQIATKVPRVSGTLRASDTAGRADQLSYEIAKRGRELKRDIESTLCGTQVATAGSIVSARACAGLASWCFTNHVNTTGNTTGTVSAFSSGYANGTIVVGTAAALVQADLLSAIALCWTNGGDPTMILMDAANKQIASGFSGIATQYRDNPQAGPATIIGAADVFVSDFGTHSLIASRFTQTDIVYLIDPEYVQLGFLRPIQQIDLAKTGDNDRAMILAEFTLQVSNPDAHGIILGTT